MPPNDRDESNPIPESPWEARRHPGRIGQYRLLDILGEGGMGIVYLAEQMEPIRRRVALKIIKVGMDTREVVARFDSERQALAVMDHPNIAQVLDGGATETGRLYFVMELVHGTPITDYADTHKLSVEERIRLFIDVCDGVQHAHQKGVIHRDLKPTNVLVMVQGTKPVAKIIDFGIAKAVGQRLTTKTLVTRAGQIVGTPAYMSPEQAEMSSLDIDTRSDIYSLGVMLYELLVGTLPLDLATRPGHSVPRALRELEITPPSTKLTTLGDASARVAQLRRTTPASLRRELNGDLDWIVLKAMDKDRTRRYETANGLALDLMRHLANEPVRAGPPTAGYRMAKFVRRHRTGLVAAGITVLSVALGVYAAIWGSRRARNADTRSVFSMLMAAHAYQTDGNLEQAEQAYESALRLMQKLGSTHDLQVANAMVDLGGLYVDMGRYDDAVRVMKRALDIEADPLESESGHYQMSSEFTLLRLAGAYLNQKKYTEAQPYLKRIVDIESKRMPPNDRMLAFSWKHLGFAYYYGGDYANGGVAYRRALEIMQAALRPDTSTITSALTKLGEIATKQKDYEKAEQLLRQSLSLKRKKLKPDDPQIAASSYDLGVVYSAEGRFAEAEPLFKRALEIQKSYFSPRDPILISTLKAYATLLEATGRNGEARKLEARLAAARDSASGR